MTLRPRRPSAATLERVLAEAKAAAPTYPEIGATSGKRLPVGYRHAVAEDPEGFSACGTLPGHPEKGEVWFAIGRDGAGEVVFRIVSFSCTVDPLVRLQSPFTRRLQRRVTERSLDAITAAAAGGDS